MDNPDIRIMACEGRGGSEDDAHLASTTIGTKTPPNAADAKPRVCAFMGHCRFEKLKPTIFS